MLKINVPLEDRPRCIIEGCNNPAHHTGGYRKDGSCIFRKYCGSHHTERGKLFNEIKSQTDRRSAPVCRAAGCKKKTNLMGTDISGNPLYTVYCPDHLNLSTAYAAVRKNYCENIDGRLGFVCTTTILLAAQLEVDHIDGNHLNNDLENLQTLCGCCHKYKTIINEDWKTPGRKTRNSLSKDSDSPD